MYRSITVEARSSASAFLAAIQRDLYRFGRDDAILVTIGTTTTFIWQPSFNAVGSAVLRQASLKARLQGQKARLEAIEAKLPTGYFSQFDVDLTLLNPEIVACSRGSADEALFEYVACGQSLSAETSKMRVGKFLIYDKSRTPQRLAGILGVKSPMYFDGARDRHLGWPPLFEMIAGVRTKSQAAIDLRNIALRSIYNICVCMAVPPYDSHRVGKLIASLAFSPQVISHLEGTYNDPVLGMTTTGGWGGSAGQYERIRVAFPPRPDGTRAKLFTRTHGARRSLNYPLHLFDAAVFDSAYRLLLESSVSARPFRNFASDSQSRRRMLLTACRVIGLPRSAIATNLIAHYFGVVSEPCRAALFSLNDIASPPVDRSISLVDLLAVWRDQAFPPPLKGVAASRLSTLAT